MTTYKALTIAGSDTSGGAGIQADLKTFQELNVYGMTALTTIVAQGAHDWFHHVFPIDLSVVEAQLESVLAGIGVDALKTGMLGTGELVELIAGKLDKYPVRNVVIDPVMVCKGVDDVLNPDAAVKIKELLLPRATVVTPNLVEAAILSGSQPITTIDQMKEAATAIYAQGAKYVLIKGGGRLKHENAIDLLYDGSTFELLESDKIDTTYNHGAGCTYSAAITAELAKGKSVKDAVHTAKAFISAAIRHAFPLNRFVGPTNHAAYRLFGVR